MAHTDMSCQHRRKKALIAENACSIGLKSGEYGGRKINLHSIIEIQLIVLKEIAVITYEPLLLSEHEPPQHDVYYNCQVRARFEDLGMD